MNAFRSLVLTPALVLSAALSAPNLAAQTPVGAGEFPSVVQVLQATGSTYTTLGVVVDPHWVLVTAQDVDKADGSLDGVVSSSLKVDDGTSCIPVASVRIHPGYTPMGGFAFNDLALLELGNPTSVIAATLALTSSPNFAGQAATAVWRDNSANPCLTLTKATFTVLSNSNLESQWGAPQINNGNIGVQSPTLAPNPGPLFVNYQGATVLAGIFSWQAPVPSPSFPAVYSRVSFFKNWIDTTIHSALTPGAYTNTANGCGSGCQPNWVPTLTVPTSVMSTTVFSDSSGSALYLGTVGFGVVKSDGATSSTLGNLEGNVRTLASFKGALYAGGMFMKIGGSPLGSQIAKWDGATWSQPGGGFNGVNTFTTFHDGNSLALYAGTGFAGVGAGVSKWDGASWSSLGPWTHGDVNALAVFGGELYAAAWGSGGWGGTGHDAVVAKWNGANWAVLNTWTNGQVHALTVFNGELYAAGYFPVTGTVGADPIAKWNGASWSMVGGLTDSRVQTLTVFDNGSGPALYAGGDFTVMGGVVVTTPFGTTIGGGVTANSVAKWNGTSWSALGSGIDSTGEVLTLTVFNDGSGAALYAGGEFTVAGGVPTLHIAKWGCPLTPSPVAFGTGSAGLSGPHTLGVNQSPKVNSPAFAFTSDNAPPSSLGLGLVSDVLDLAGSDPFAIGVLLHVNLLTAAEVYAFDFVSDASGNGLTVGTGIPNSPILIGRTYHTQALWAWPQSMGSLPPFNLSTSKGLSFTIQP